MRFVLNNHWTCRDPTCFVDLYEVNMSTCNLANDLHEQMYYKKKRHIM